MTRTWDDVRSELGEAEPLGEDERCPVCLGINPIVTTVVWSDGGISGTTLVACGCCGATTDENRERARQKGILW